jgi:alkylation response protein AidB-like acyl-CoA dehydrogenase
MSLLDESLVVWLQERAEALDTGAADGDALLPRLAVAGLFKIGVSASEGGSGGNPSAAIGAVAELAQHSLSAALVFWAQRAVVECVLASPNRDLVRKLVPALLRGQLAGAPALSNAMKFLGGLDHLRTHGAPTPGGVRLNGAVPWATNLHPQGFVAIIAAGHAAGKNPSVIAIPHHAPGLQREPDLDLVALRGTNTAALRIEEVALGDAWQIHPDARTFLPRLRPLFVGLQCGLGLGLARASVLSTQQLLQGARSVLSGELAALDADIRTYWEDLSIGLDSGRLYERPLELLHLRLRMVEMATNAVQLELQALGGRALLRMEGRNFSRRSREVAFLSVVTPTVV